MVNNVDYEIKENRETTIVKRLLEEVQKTHCSACCGVGFVDTPVNLCANCRGTGQSLASLDKKISLVIDALTNIFNKVGENCE